MKHLTQIDLSSSAAANGTAWLVDGPQGDDDCAMRVVVWQSQEDGDAWIQTCTVDRICHVVEGEVAVLIGNEVFRADADAAVLIPAGMPHRLSKAGAGRAVFLDAFAPAPSTEVLFRPTTSRRVADAAACVRRVRQERFVGDGFAYQSLVDRQSGSQRLRSNLVQVQPGAGSPDLHIHAFDQFYFILEGQMRVTVGRTVFDAPKHAFVRLPAGTVHKNWNASGAVERHIAFLVPEPASGEIFDYAVDIHDREAALMAPVQAGAAR